MVIELTLSTGRQVDMRPGASDATCGGDVGTVRRPGSYRTGRWTGGREILSARVRSVKNGSYGFVRPLLEGW